MVAAFQIEIARELRESSQGTIHKPVEWEQTFQKGKVVTNLRKTKKCVSFSYSRETSETVGCGRINFALLIALKVQDRARGLDLVLVSVQPFAATRDRVRLFCFCFFLCVCVCVCVRVCGGEGYVSRAKIRQKTRGKFDPLIGVRGVLSRFPWIPFQEFSLKLRE